MRGRARLLACVLPDYARTAWWGLVGHRQPGTRTRRVVQGVVLSDRGVLLTVRVDLRGWELPGGEPEPGESLEEALAREVLEETGIALTVERKTGEYHRTGFLPHVAHVYRCRAAAERLAPSAETPQVGWFALDALPDTLFPWYRRPLRDALDPGEGVVVRHERQGLRAILAGMRIDLRMRFRGPASS